MLLCVATLALAPFLEDTGIVSVALRPDGKVMATGRWDESIEIVTVLDRKPVRIHKGHRGHVTGLSYSPDGSLLASSSSDGTIKIWSGTDAKLIRTIKAGTSFVSGVAVAPDGKTIFSSGYDNLVKAWSTKTGSLVRSYKGLPSDAYSLAVSPDGHYVAGVGPDDGIAVWNTASGVAIYKHQGADVNNCGVGFSPDSKQLAVGSLSGKLRVLDVKTREDRYPVYSQAGGSISALAWVSNDVIVSIGYKPSADRWKLAKTIEASEPIELYNKAMFQGLALSKDREMFVAGGSVDGTGVAVAVDPLRWSISWIDSEEGCR